MCLCPLNTNAILFQILASHLHGSSPFYCESTQKCAHLLCCQRGRGYPATGAKKVFRLFLDRTAIACNIAILFCGKGFDFIPKFSTFRCRNIILG